MNCRFASRLLALVVLFALVADAQAKVALPALFSDHMVLQRDVPVNVWGWAEPGEEITVTLAGQTKSAKAGRYCDWSLVLDALPASNEPMTLTVKGKNTIEIKDVVVGEVWLCSGQSNMEMQVDGVNNHEKEAAEANYPQIRMFHVAHAPMPTPQKTCKGAWYPCSPAIAGKFSATALFFGRELHKELGVPVGLIHASWGGTPIQAWMSDSANKTMPESKLLYSKLEERKASWDPAKAKVEYDKVVAQIKVAIEKAKAEGKEPPFMPMPPCDPNVSPSTVCRLYNGMIAPLVPYTLRGAIWYQGESNSAPESAPFYGRQLRAMISGWRADWGQGNFPFLYVQLPNWQAPQTKPSEMNGWSIVREHFLQTLAVENTGMAVTVDIGDANNIHPKNKQDVGKRLAAWALNKVYGKDVVACGPLCKSFEKNGDKAVVHFDYVAGGLKAKGGKLEGFALAGEDKKFVWADATIVGDTVVVSSPSVPNPAALRYGWAINPKCNLYNDADLPASPFRTDSWAE